MSILVVKAVAILFLKALRLSSGSSEKVYWETNPYQLSQQQHFHFSSKSLLNALAERLLFRPFLKNM
ncbi:MAG TPA: hypothetical protein VK388_09155 [Pyrinomonadaceae bacterium]|nr:hypothetical protein [Pyrinomonadaceae bacterium]